MRLERLNSALYLRFKNCPVYKKNAQDIYMKNSERAPLRLRKRFKSSFNKRAETNVNAYFAPLPSPQ